MDDAPGNSWTRRRVGGALTGALASLLVLVARGDSVAKKRCEKLGERCNPRNTNQVCCGPLICRAVAGRKGTHCCKSRYAACKADGECCINLRCVGEGKRKRVCDIATRSS